LAGAAAAGFAGAVAAGFAGSGGEPAGVPGVPDGGLPAGDASALETGFGVSPPLSALGGDFCSSAIALDACG